MANHKPEVRVYPPGYGHTPLTADYRPWHTDVDFLTAWTAVRDRTLVDQPRLYELWELTEQALKVPGTFLEVGTWRGGSAALMGLRLKHLGAHRPLVIADTFSGVAKAGPHDPYYEGGEHSDTDLDTVTAFLHSLDLSNFRLLSGVFPEDTAHHVPDETIALCHIDVDVHNSAQGVFEWVVPRIPLGGIIVFDDYGFFGCEGVTRFVHELRARDDVCVIANVNGHAVVVKTHTRTRERHDEP
ncbi:MAG: TylF/MycF/NovP-related O-methyltransferase [Alkalispirochaeta sp.]